MSKEQQPAFERKRAITVPLLKPEIDVPFFVRIDSEMRESKPIKQDGKVAMEPATIVNVTNLATGELQELIVPSVLKGILEEQFADGSYVGMSFEIIKRDKKKGKRYHTFEVYEIEA